MITSPLLNTRGVPLGKVLLCGMRRGDRTMEASSAISELLLLGQAALHGYIAGADLKSPIDLAEALHRVRLFQGNF